MDTHDPTNTFAAHPATLLNTPVTVMTALLNWRKAAQRYTKAQRSRSLLTSWYAYRLSRAYLAIFDVLTTQIDTSWYGKIMILALDDGINPFNDGQLVAFLANSLLP
jgi:hypothetical protein